MTDTSAAAASQMSCRLLELPGELKNRIYRLVLVKPEDSPIVITSTGYDRGGGLLQVCKEIRSEARKIFYYENKFTHVVRQYNSTPIHNFYCLLADCGPRIDEENIKLKCQTDDEPSWPNLLQWLRRVHEEYADRPTLECGTEKLRENNVTDLDSHICRIMFLTAVKLQYQPWDFVENMLVGMRPSLKVADQQWADD